MRLVFSFVLACSAMCAQNTPAASGLPPLPPSIVQPALPQAWPDISYTPSLPQTNGCCTQIPGPGVHWGITPMTLGTLLSSGLLACGDEIWLDTTMGPYLGNWVFPALACNVNNKILIRPRDVAGNWPAGFPVDGTRILQGQAALTYSFQSLNNLSVLSFATGASGYYFVGGEFTEAPGVSGMWNLITASTGPAPADIVFDRCLIHPNATDAAVRGIFADANGLAVINSQVYGFYNASQDTQALLACEGGPYLLQNNYLEAAGENLMFGGCVPAVTSPYGIPSDITVTGNQFSKNPAWRTMSPAVDVKNEFEIKRGQRVLVDSNVFENDWCSAQCEFLMFNSVGLGMASTGDGLYIWNDIAITNNLFMHGPQMVAVAGNGATAGVRILVRNNLGVDLNGQSYGAALGSLGGCNSTQNLTFDHNTALAMYPRNNVAFWFGDPPPSSNTNFTYTNNLTGGQLSANGDNELMTYQNLVSVASNLMTNNAWVGDQYPNRGVAEYPNPSFPASAFEWFFVSTQSVNGVPCNYLWWPSACYPLDWGTVGLLDFDGANAGTNLLGAALAPTSPLHTTGSDGADVGANVSAVLVAVAGVITQ